MSSQHRTHKRIVPSTPPCPHHTVVAIRPGVGQCLDCGGPCSIPPWVHGRTPRS